MPQGQSRHLPVQTHDTHAEALPETPARLCVLRPSAPSAMVSPDGEGSLTLTQAGAASPRGWEVSQVKHKMEHSLYSFLFPTQSVSSLSPLCPLPSQLLSLKLFKSSTLNLTFSLQSLNHEKLGKCQSLFTASDSFSES